MTHLLCFGLGYSARAFARRMAARGWRISASSTTPEGVARIGREGYEGFLFDGRATAPAASEALRTATHVVVSPAPDAGGDPVLRQHAADLASAPHLGWIGYLSTIGVYGNRDGGWVDETAPVAPTSDRSRWRAAAERQWLDLGQSSGKPVQIFRLAGIYGPGRSAIDNLMDGSARRIVKPGQVFNRIHVEDIAGTLVRAAEGHGREAIYNVCDDEPAPPQDVVAYAAYLLGMPVPPDLPFETATLSPMARSFYADNKRVSNARLRNELGVALEYPSYREGLSAIAAALR